jgi:hypothetical protein
MKLMSYSLLAQQPLPSALCIGTLLPTQSGTQSEIPCDFRICNPLQSSSTFIFYAEADRLEAGGFNLVMDIKFYDSEITGIHDKIIDSKNTFLLRTDKFHHF